MNQRNASMTVIGIGSYGAASAITLAKNGHEVILWGHDPEHIATLEHDRYNAAFLPDVLSPDTLHLESDLATMPAASRNIFAVVPSHVFGEVLRQIEPLMCPDARLVWMIKGLGVETERLLQGVACETLGDQILLAVTSGPTSAKELAAGLSATILLVSTDQIFADDLQQLLHCGKGFRVYSSPGFTGAQPDGAVKNVIAIDTGMPDGIGFDANTRTTLITRGLTEISHLGTALGADPATFMGIAGLGDLVLTCTDNQSRNHRLSMMFGQGMDVQSAQEKIDQMAEGYCNTKEARELAHRFGVGTSITKEIYQVLYYGRNAREAALTLLGRARKGECNNH